MLGRVSQSSLMVEFNSNLKSREDSMQKIQDQLSSGYRVRLPSDDPIATVNYMDYDSRLKEISTYNSIISTSKSKLDMTDGALDSVTQILQRVRELAVQGANGTFTKEDRQKMAVEVDQLAREMIQVGNSRFKDNALFGGTMTREDPFKAVIQTDHETGMDFLQDVRYIGNNQNQQAEVDRGEKVDVTQSGNQIFWADNMQIYSTLNVSGYMAPADSKIVVDGTEVQIRAGDNLEVIAQKINNSGTAVKAAVETKDGQSYFTLESDSPHQISLQDTNGGHVLQDLGIIDDGMYPPYNYSASAKVYSGSVFNALVDFRKALQSDDTFQIGGASLARIDNSLGNVLKYRAHVGAVSQRLDSIGSRLSSDEMYLTDAKQTAVGTDISKAMMDFKMMEFSHDVALNIGSRILPKTLLDFMR